MRYLSVCSGIEAATAAWHPLGWSPVAFSEIDPFACAVLKAHYPDVPNYGDMNEHATWPARAPGSVDLLVGGTPCQSFSVAGLRGGLADPRGNLMLVYLRLLEKYRPRWCVWENVPGVLSSNGGRDFGALLGGLAKLGYGFAYRVLDAQYVRVESHPRAVPQRRRRVFVVGCLGDWRAAAEVLLEPEGVRGDPPSRRSSRKDVAVGARLGAASGDAAVAYGARDGSPLTPDVSPTLRAGANKTGGDRPPGTDVDTVETLVVGFQSSRGTRGGDAFADVSPTMRPTTGLAPPAVAYGISPDAIDRSGEGRAGNAEERSGLGVVEGASPCLKARANAVALAHDDDAERPTVSCMAERSSADGATLEVCDDGTSNCVVTPNGGRAGRGVGAVVICQPLLEVGKRTGSSTDDVRAGLGIGDDGSPSFTLQAGARHGVSIINPDVADPILSVEGRKYTDEGSHNFRTHNIVPMDLRQIAVETRFGEFNDSATAGTIDAHMGTSGQGAQRAAIVVDPIPFSPEQITHPANGSRCEPGDPCGTISRHAPRPSVASVASGVRRLTPTECERLQGFMDGWTNVEFRGKPATDGHRYKALGNSMAVNVMRFIGERIDNYEKSRR